jgi:hypothetical protein
MAAAGIVRAACAMFPEEIRRGTVNQRAQPASNACSRSL